MTVYNVLKTMPIENDTAVVIDGSRELFRNGTGVLDEDGKPFVVLSVGMDVIDDFNNTEDKTSLLIKGSFKSKMLFV